MIKQIWFINKELFEVIIDGKVVSYKDRKTLKPVQMIPMDKRIKRQILMSRNKIDPKLIEQFNLTKAEQKEYEEAVKKNKNIEERLSEICKKDCQRSGCILQKEEKI